MLHTWMAPFPRPDSDMTKTMQWGFTSTGNPGWAKKLDSSTPRGIQASTCTNMNQHCLCHHNPGSVYNWMSVKVLKWAAEFHLMTLNVMPCLLLKLPPQTPQQQPGRTSTSVFQVLWAFPLQPDPSSSRTTRGTTGDPENLNSASPWPTPLAILVTATTTHHNLWHVHLGDNCPHDLRGNRRTSNNSWKEEENTLETSYLFPGVVPQMVLHSQI